MTKPIAARAARAPLAYAVTAQCAGILKACMTHLVINGNETAGRKSAGGPRISASQILRRLLEANIGGAVARARIGSIDRLRAEVSATRVATKNTNTGG